VNGMNSARAGQSFQFHDCGGLNWFAKEKLFRRNREI
jgi:hypothetical protein